jgi:ribosomal protein S18 acetylase RimI-like enzyme
MEIEAADATTAEVIADRWVELARGQRDYGSHLLAEANRTRNREAVVRHAVTDTLLVARVDGEFAGFVTFSLESGSFEQDVNRGLVENLYVDPTHRRETVGERLLAAAEAKLTQRDADVVALEAMAENEAARAFYRAQGYAPHRVEFEKALESDTHSRTDE